MEGSQAICKLNFLNLFLAVTFLLGWILFADFEPTSAEEPQHQAESSQPPQTSINPSQSDQGKGKGNIIHALCTVQLTQRWNVPEFIFSFSQGGTFFFLPLRLQLILRDTGSPYTRNLWQEHIPWSNLTKRGDLAITNNSQGGTCTSRTISGLVSNQTPEFQKNYIFFSSFVVLIVTTVTAREWSTN